MRSTGVQTSKRIPTQRRLTLTRNRLGKTGKIQEMNLIEFPKSLLSHSKVAATF